VLVVVRRSGFLWIDPNGWRGMTYLATHRLGWEDETLDRVIVLKDSKTYSSSSSFFVFS
jgi:hypothetical protein